MVWGILGSFLPNKVLRGQSHSLISPSLSCSGAFLSARNQTPICFQSRIAMFFIHLFSVFFAAVVLTQSLTLEEPH